MSYHFYASPTPQQDINNWQYTFFDQADRFLATVRYIDAIRQRLSPQTKTDTNELGVILASDEAEIAESKAHPDTIPTLYWNAAGALRETTSDPRIGQHRSPVYFHHSLDTQRMARARV